MRPFFSKPLAPYVFGILLLLIITGAIQSLLTDAFIILIAIQGIEFIILAVIMLHLYDTYMQPIKRATKTVDELVQGNYRARIHHSSQGSVADLSNKINMLARSLSELTIQEEINAKQLLTVINNIDSGLALIDEKGYIHLVNSKFLSIFGKETSHYVGYLYYNVIDHQEIQQTIQKTFLYEEDMRGNFTTVGEFGEKHIEIVCAPIFNERNLFRGAVMVLYDITEFKNLEIMRKDFVANVSHELKTPITSIRGFAETLLDVDNDDVETKAQFLKIINEETKRMQYLIEDLLTLSKLERNNFQVMFEEVNFNQILNEIIPIINHQVQQKRITFNVHSSNDLLFKADREKVKQVLLNLLGNAISYSFENGVIDLHANEEDGFIRISIADTGIGIEQEVLPRIFERFYRVDKARSRNTGGTGLGLAIVKHIVEVHKGKITVTSEPNKGTTFSVFIPKEPTN